MRFSIQRFKFFIPKFCYKGSELEINLLKTERELEWISATGKKGQTFSSKLRLQL